MKRRPTLLIKRLVCETCGIARDIPRRANKNRPSGHAKHMWCATCRRVTKFQEQ